MTSATRSRVAIERTSSAFNRKQVKGMTNILVVDDSAVDRRVVGGLLEQRAIFTSRTQRTVRPR